MIGINTVSSQSGRAYFADYLKNGYQMIGYARHSMHGTTFINAVSSAGGIYMDRPQNKNQESKVFLPLKDSRVTQDLEELVSNSELIILAEPSHYFVQSVKEMVEAGLLKYRVPLVLSPSRTFSSPYLWEILGEGYPIACFSTCAYSCKAPEPDVAYIKRRKRNWIISLEGEFYESQIGLLQELFPQAVINHIPATTSLGNVGAIFHPATYLLNYDEIKRCESSGKTFSFYMDGIAARPEVGEVLEAIDQMRLEIAAWFGYPVFGLKRKPFEEQWAELMQNMRIKEKTDENLRELRRIRRDSLQILNSSITSCKHWLDYTYGVKRIPDEPLYKAIGRTPTYQKNSVPQERYVNEDISTGLLPLRNMAARFGIDTSAADYVLEIFQRYYNFEDAVGVRTLNEFSDEYIKNYLQGKYFKLI
ncbi:MAG: NAD/NADP octopine/nopaline dehydrogenase family protein [Eubacteriales bacterium]|nr:NAD/NADP octopine/nopaline dehydrogenase family protein [Eubacteriales bacterium]